MAHGCMTGRRTTTIVTPEKLAEMVDLLGTARSFREMSRRTGVSLPTLRKHLAPFVALMQMQGHMPPAMKRRKRSRISAAQIEEMAERLLTATSLREVARSMDLDKQTVFARARPIIAAMREAGTLGLCECGQERFHQRICARTAMKIAPHRWETEEHLQKRASIVAAIMTGETFGAIAASFGAQTKASARQYLRYLSPAQRERRKALERQRSRRVEMNEALRPYRDEVYALIAAAVPRWLSPATRDDAISDLYVGVLDGSVSIENIAAEAKRFASRAAGQYESKFGPRSLDEEMFDDGGATYLDRIECPSALAAFDEIRFAREEIPCL